LGPEGAKLPVKTLGGKAPRAVRGKKPYPKGKEG